MTDFRTSVNHVCYMDSIVMRKGRPVFLNAFDRKTFTDLMMMDSKDHWAELLKEQVRS